MTLPQLQRKRSQSLLFPLGEILLSGHALVCSIMAWPWRNLRHPVIPVCPHLDRWVSSQILPCSITAPKHPEILAPKSPAVSQTSVASPAKPQSYHIVSLVTSHDGDLRFRKIPSKRNTEARNISSWGISEALTWNSWLVRMQISIAKTVTGMESGAIRLSQVNNIKGGKLQNLKAQNNVACPMPWRYLVSWHAGQAYMWSKMLQVRAKA